MLRSKKNVIVFCFVFLVCSNQLTSSFHFLKFLFIGCGREQQPVVVLRYFFSSPTAAMRKLTARITWDVGTCRSMFASSPQPLFAMHSGILGSDVGGNSVAESCSDGAMQCAGWKTAVAAAAALPALQATATPWTSPEYGQQQERSPQTLAYSATADVYMQTLCPSYTMLTYTHAPLLTNFGVSRTWIGKRAIWGIAKHSLMLM